MVIKIKLQIKIKNVKINQLRDGNIDYLSLWNRRIITYSQDYFYFTTTKIIKNSKNTLDTPIMNQSYEEILRKNII